MATGPEGESRDFQDRFRLIAPAYLLYEYSRKFIDLSTVVVSTAAALRFGSHERQLYAPHSPGEAIREKEKGKETRNKRPLAECRVMSMNFYIEILSPPGGENKRGDSRP